ncbi:MAG: DMT family transporter [Eubacterium sp.]|nr:DMT family transporter [Eubacterium sp.]
MNIIKDKKIILAEIGLLLVAMFWGMGFVAGKYVLADMGPFDLMAYRYGFAFIVMFICAVKHLKALNKKTLKAGALIGTMMFVGNMLQTIGLQYTTPGKQTFIICMYTVIVPLLSWLIFKEKASKNICIAAVIAFVGIALLTLQNDLSIGFGDGLTFLFAISFSMHVILVGRFMKDMDPFAFALVQIGVCAVWSIAACLFFGEGANITDLSMPGVLGMLQLVFLNTVFAFILQNTCQQIAPANHTAILLSTETVFGTFFAVTLAGEVFHGRMLVGCVLMFVAIIVSNIPSKGGK